MHRDTGWFTSSYSAAASNACVEVRLTDAGTAVRDSKNPAGPRLHLPGERWAAFVDRLKR
ncbi:DUF397 domain-containing protein [Saccharothrix australiensis]|uniref:Uncharacterized protein DUF397 n=1 Tax=Saccharothrix australiensis TaxID=2072 RepID=A0A495W710_9PSEU|nr:DUF397 domain-containing protein [Saccharothrix australiensis]RKT57064.1 uncharacterized protein DUF397 [Saccharothrix australiensis]